MPVVLILLILLFSSSVKAQDSIQLRLSLQAASPSIAAARGFNRARTAVHLSCRPFAGSSAQNFEAQNDSLWSLQLPKGSYLIRLSSFAFDTSERYVELKGDSSLQLDLNLDSLPYCYENGARFSYIPGSIAFEQSLSLRFKAGEPAENQAWLQEKIPLRQLEVLAPNVFYINLRLNANKTVNQLLYERKYGALDLGCYLGDELRRAIEKIQATGRLAYANPQWHWANP